MELRLMRRRPRGPSALLVVLLLGAIACSEDTITLGGPLAFEISANTPVAVADSLVLVYDVVGRSLLGMEVLWGDAEVDSVFFLSAQTAGGRVAHLYAAPGTYTVTATVDDSFEGSTTREVPVTISP